MSRTIEPASFPLADDLGMRLGLAADGEATATLEVTERHLNPHGALHGAVTFALIDTTMGAATLSVIDEGELCATIEIQVRFVRPVFDGRLSCVSRVVYAGRRVVHLGSEVHDEQDRLVATATGTYSRLGAP